MEIGTAFLIGTVIKSFNRKQQCVNMAQVLWSMSKTWAGGFAEGRAAIRNWHCHPKSALPSRIDTAMQNWHCHPELALPPHWHCRPESQSEAAQRIGHVLIWRRTGGGCHYLGLVDFAATWN